MDHIRYLAAASVSTDSSDPSSNHSLSNRSNFYSHSYKNGSEKQLLPPGTVSFGQYTLPRKHTKRSGSASESSNRSAICSSREHSTKKKMSYYDSVSKPIFVSKCLCMVTRIPIVYSSENFLRFLWAIIQDKKILKDEENLPIESFIYWVLHEVKFFKEVFIINSRYLCLYPVLIYKFHLVLSVN